MAELVALHFGKNDWDVFVVEGLVRGALTTTLAKTDLSGRMLPDWINAEQIKLRKRSESDRLANQLRGWPKTKRREFFTTMASENLVTKRNRPA